MRNKIVIAAIIVISGCVPARKGLSDSRTGAPDGLLLEDVISNNLSANDFQIQKASVEVRTLSGEQKFAGNMKFKKPATYLFSLRSNSGIEAARIFITGDTLLINDRINKKLYRGSQEYMRKKYGFNTEIIPAIFGDIVSNLTEDQLITCHKGYSEVSYGQGENRLKYNIDCARRKVRMLEFSGLSSESKGQIEFSDFISSQEMKYPRLISISADNGSTVIKIKIERVIKGIDGEITFIPGKNYEDIVLR